MTMFGKDIENMAVITADFLPDDSQLFFLVADAENNIHVLQYDPEHPKSLVGTRLIHKASFAAGLEISTLTMLPRTRHPTSPFFPQPDQITQAPQNPEYLVLATTLSGSLAMVTTIPESSYRRLNIVQSQIINGEEHAAGLNPKAFRSSSAKQLEVGMRGVLDGGFLRRFIDLSEVRKNEIAGKARCSETDVRAELAEIEASVGYF
jgi:cleavage and polyadenylation specificity factor subunit 1